MKVALPFTAHELAGALESAAWKIASAGLTRAERIVLERVAATATHGADVAQAAKDFCAELQEDAGGVPRSELERLHAALDAFEGIPPE